MEHEMRKAVEVTIDDSCSDSDDDHDNPAACQQPMIANQEGHFPKGRPPLPHRLKKTKKVHAALKKLDLLQQEHDLRNFYLKSKPIPNPFNDSCHEDASQDLNVDNEAESKKNRGEGKKKQQRLLEPYGPFHSCQAYHSQGRDYSVFPDFTRPPEKKIVFVNPYGRPNSAPSRPTSGQSADVNRCRNCPKYNISSCNADDFYEEYKSNITYSKTKIGKLHGEKITEKYEAYERGRDGNTSKPSSAKEMRSDKQIQQLEKVRVPFALPAPLIRKNSKKPGQGQGDVILYGPAAIASVSGYNYQRKTNRSTPRAKKSKPLKADDQKEAQLLEILCFEIPQASDNVRYYDDDTDPMITELLAKAPFTLNTEPAHPLLIKTASSYVKPMNSTAIKPMEIFESTIDSGRKGTKKSSECSDRIILRGGGNASENSKTVSHIQKYDSNKPSKGRTIPETGLAEAHTLGAKVTPRIPIDVKRNLGLQATPRSIGVSQKLTKVSATPRTGKKVAKPPDRKKSNPRKVGPRRFHPSISTVSVPQPSTKYRKSSTEIQP